MDLSKVEKILKSNVKRSQQSSYYSEDDNSYTVNYDKLNPGGRLHSICASFDDDSILFGVGGYD